MCGIAGIFHYDSDQPVDERLLVAMRDVMRHRGPDGAGLWIGPDRQIGLAHRRLSIIDLSEAASQPMSNEDGSLWVVFNGEIYNHAALRAELEQAGGHCWATDHSDTEVILHAFEEWGIDCLQRFRGMFAFALWDGRAQQVWLVRDRIGIKPLYYSLIGGTLLFASEIKALLQNPDQPRAVNEEALYHYLSLLATPAPDTLFAGINKLPGGCWLRVGVGGQVREQRYWDVWDHPQPLDHLTEDQIAERLIAELREAVALRKVSDVPVGTFLSGGIDSSTNTALFSEGQSSPVKTFSIGYAGDYPSYPSELPYARQMAAQVGADYHERLLCEEDLITFLPSMVYLQDEPIADPVCVPVYYLAEMARQNGVTVCQVGEGADELFCGYPVWRLQLRLQRLDDLPVPRAAKRAGLWGLRVLGRTERSSYEWLRRGAAGQPVFWGGAEALFETRKKRILSPRLRDQFHDLTTWDALAPIYRRYCERTPDPAHLNWMSYLDLNLRLPELLLMRVDKMTMGASLESRVPFLDHRFVEFSMSIPAHVKTHNGTLKYILKKAVRGLIPDTLIDRRKQGFGVPVYEWFFGRLGSVMEQELKDFCAQTDYFDYAEIVQLMQQGIGPQVWYLLNFVLWWKEYIR